MNSINAAGVFVFLLFPPGLHVTRSSALRLRWGGVTVGVVWPGPVSALPSPLHLLHFS